MTTLLSKFYYCPLLKKILFCYGWLQDIEDSFLCYIHCPFYALGRPPWHLTPNRMALNLIVCVCVCVCVCVLVVTSVRLFPTLWTVAHQAPLSVESPGRNTGVGWHVLLQGIFLTQG